MSLPKIAVCIPTYNRRAIVCATVDLLFKNLKYSGALSFIIGCDGTDDTPHALDDFDDLTVLDTPSGGIGANVNRLVDMARVLGCDQTITMDDDHHLVAPLNLDRHARKLDTDAGAGRIHLLMEAQGDEHFDTYKFDATLDKDHYWCVHWASSEHFIMSFRPALSHMRWWDVMGPLPEGLRTGQTEGIYAAQCKQLGMQGVGINVLVPLIAHGAETWHHNAAPFSWNQRGM